MIVENLDEFPLYITTTYINMQLYNVEAIRWIIKKRVYTGIEKVKALYAALDQRQISSQKEIY